MFGKKTKRNQRLPRTWPGSQRRERKEAVFGRWSRALLLPRKTLVVSPEVSSPKYDVLLGGAQGGGELFLAHFFGKMVIEQWRDELGG